MSKILLGTHLFGVILWVGGMATAAWTAASVMEDPEDQRQAALRAARKSVLMLATPGMLLAWVAGLGMLIPNFGELYAHAGWMHGKLTVLLILTALSGVFSGKLRKAADGKKPMTGRFAGVITLVTIALTVVILGLVTLRPGG